MMEKKLIPRKRIIARIIAALLLVLLGYLIAQIGVAAQKRAAVDEAIGVIQEEVSDTQEELRSLQSNVSTLYAHTYSLIDTLDMALGELQEVQQEINNLEHDRTWMIEKIDELQAEIADTTTKNGGGS